jgi:hypothetical protein
MKCIVIVTNRRSQMCSFDTGTVSNVQARTPIISNAASAQHPTSLTLLHSLNQPSPCTRDATFNTWVKHPMIPSHEGYERSNDGLGFFSYSLYCSDSVSRRPIMPYRTNDGTITHYQTDQLPT